VRELGEFSVLMDQCDQQLIGVVLLAELNGWINTGVC